MVCCWHCKGDIKRVRSAILLGVAVPLAMFLCWDAAILGSLGEGGLAQGEDPLAALRGMPGLAPLIDTFSLLAIATSYIGFVLGLTDFIADYLEVLSRGRAMLWCLINNMVVTKSC